MLKIQRGRPLVSHQCLPALVVFAIVAHPAAAQEAVPTQQPTDAPAAAPASPPSNSGLLDGLGKLLKSPADLLPSMTKQDTATKPEVAPPSPPPGPAAPAAPAAAEAPSPPSSRVLPGLVSGRELCPQMPNSGPDCQAGAAKLCQSKGYSSGKSLNIDTSFSCSAKIARATGKACGNEHYVTSAFCS